MRYAELYFTADVAGLFPRDLREAVEESMRVSEGFGAAAAVLAKNKEQLPCEQLTGPTASRLRAATTMTCRTYRQGQRSVFMPLPTKSSRLQLARSTQ